MGTVGSRFVAGTSALQALWHRPEAVLDRVAASGAAAVMLPVEWARWEPTAGRVDGAAVDRYARIIEACELRDLAPWALLHSGPVPLWFGTRGWLPLDAPDRFVRWVGDVATAVGDRVRGWVTVDRPEELAYGAYVRGTRAPGERLAIGPALRTVDAVLSAHVRAYDVLRGPGGALVTAHVGLGGPAAAYERGPLLVDLLCARLHGVGRDQLHRWLEERRRSWYARRPGGARSALVRRLAASAVPLEQAFPRTTVALYGSHHPCTLDVVTLTAAAADAGVAFLRPPGIHLDVVGDGPAGAEVRHCWRPAPDADADADRTVAGATA